MPESRLGTTRHPDGIATNPGIQIAASIGDFQQILATELGLKLNKEEVVIVPTLLAI